MMDVKTTYSGQLLAKPLLASHRAFLNVAYENRKEWKFDATVQWYGEKRLPNTSMNSIENQLGINSPDYFLVNGQITKTFGKKFAVYLGVENLLNFRQKKAILSAELPTGQEFDASMVWGPIFGRNVYGGFRYKIFKK